MLQTGEVVELRFTGVPELAHLEVQLVTRATDDESGYHQVLEFNLGADLAHELLGELITAIELLERD